MICIIDWIDKYISENWGAVQFQDNGLHNHAEHVCLKFLQKKLDCVILKSFTYFSNQIHIYGYFAWFPGLDTLGLRAYCSITFPGSQEENWCNLKLFLPAQNLQGIKHIQGIKRLFTGRKDGLSHLFSFKTN